MAITHKSIEERLKDQPKWVRRAVDLTKPYDMLTENTFAPPIRNLVFEGGGVKGIGFPGAIEALEKRGMLGGVKSVAGSSAGGITAMLLA